MERSSEIKELAAALAKAQGEMDNIEKSHTAKVQSKKGEGSSYSYDYADLADVLRCARPLLSKNGLSLTGIPTADGTKVSYAPLLMHESGQFIQYDALVLEAADTNPQSIGSAITYGRRYAISAVLNIASEADDDGNAAAGQDAETAQKAPNPECPKCKTNKSVIKGKEEYGGGWVCYAKKQGCGHKWHDAPAEPPAKEPIKEPAKEPASIADCKEFLELRTTLHGYGAKTQGLATKVINYAVPEIGDIDSLKNRPSECRQVSQALKTCGLSGKEIIERATSAA